MKKYDVIVTETISYAVEIHADSKSEAADVGEQLIIDTDDRNKWFSECSDRSATATEI